MSVEAMKQALEALEHAAECVQTNYLPDHCGHDWDEQIESLRQAIAEAEQEPRMIIDASAPIVMTPHPAFANRAPKREWVGLTDDELPVLAQDSEKVMSLEQTRRFYKRIEAKLKQKNGYAEEKNT